MGRHSARKREFLTRHPICCFCGGNEAAVTEDHIPARSLFFRRQWPEGYVFPACMTCNAGASDDELVMAVLVRMGNQNDQTDDHEKEIEKALSGLRFRLPTIFHSLKEISRVDTRRFLRSRGIQGTVIPGLGEAYLLRVPAEVIAVTERYAAKLGKALHYLHTGKVVPATGAVVTRVFTNGDLLNSNVPDKFFAVLGGVPVLKRDVTPLESQFTYRFGIASAGEGAGYWIRFGESMAMIATVFLDEAEYLRRRAERNAATGAG